MGERPRVMNTEAARDYSNRPAMLRLTNKSGKDSGTTVTPYTPIPVRIRSNQGLVKPSSTIESENDDDFFD